MTTQAPPRIERLLAELRDRLVEQQCKDGDRVLTLTVKIRRGQAWKRTFALQDEEELT